MIAFSNEVAAREVQERIQALAEIDLAGFWGRALRNCADPDRALINLERWLLASSNPAIQLAHLAESTRSAGLLLQLFGASQSLADGLVQNPELAALVTEGSGITRVPTKKEIFAEGQALLKSAASYDFKLDRLRYLKQRWRLPIIVNDLSGSWSQQMVWRSISVLAECLVQLTFETAWAKYASQSELSGECPLGVIAFGKLGGCELNYSSDIDLVFVLEDWAEQSAADSAAKFAEMASRALSQQMGRGALYRVDLRLRPFGGAGPLTPSMKSVEAYYAAHAHSWEVQALIRSRVIFGSSSLDRRWQTIVENICYKNAPSHALIEELQLNRKRLEETQPMHDFKNGVGGIRDCEFGVQFLQISNGWNHPNVRFQNTLEALTALQEEKFVSTAAAQGLRNSYIFLRKLEHRCQLVYDQQTHSIPLVEKEREHLARLMGFLDWEGLGPQIAKHREAARKAYLQITGQRGQDKPRDLVLRGLEPQLAQGLHGWIDALPDPERIYAKLTEDGAKARALNLVEFAPDLVEKLRASEELTRLVLFGEPDAAQTADYSFRRIAISADWTLDDSKKIGPKLAELYDALLKEAAAQLGATFDIIALGSYGEYDPSLNSDLDILLLVSDEHQQSQAEEQAQKFLASFGRLKRSGWPVDIDLRLRPEGSQGLLVRTHAAFKIYELERMEPWERFALGEARLVSGNQASLAEVLRAAYALPLTPERLAELLAMKKRIETERVKPYHWKREVKLGCGSLNDILWLVHVYEMRYPTALQVDSRAEMTERIARLNRAGFCSVIEKESLSTGYLHLVKVRNRLSLLGFEKDIVPENPDKLDGLGRAMGFPSGYEFQSRHNELINDIREIYEDGLDRLGV